MKIWDKEIELKKYTRKIDREYNKLLMDGINIKVPELDINWEAIPEKEYDSKLISNMQTANDYLVVNMTWLSQDEVDDLSPEEYNQIITEINKVTNKTPTSA